MNKNSFAGFALIALGIIAIVFGSVLGIPVIVLGLFFQLKGRGKDDRLFYRLPSDLSAESRFLRFCIASSWGALVLAMIVSAIEAAGLPQEVVKFSAAQLEAAPGYVIGAMVAFFVINMIGSVGVFFLQRWGKGMYVSGFMGMLLLMPFMGSMIVTPFFGLVDELLSILTGVILYLLYFSTAREHFGR